MSKKYNINTKTTYKDFCDKANDIRIVENNLEEKKITLLDKFGNRCQIEYNEDNIIIALTKVGANDPVFILNLLVTISGAIFLCEDDFKNCIQIPLLNKPLSEKVEITKDYYEGFTQYFKNYINIGEILRRNSNYLTRKKECYLQIDSQWITGPSK
jgi:hypothetical protein